MAPNGITTAILARAGAEHRQLTPRSSSTAGRAPAARRPGRRSRPRGSSSAARSATASDCASSATSRGIQLGGERERRVGAGGRRGDQLRAVGERLQRRDPVLLLTRGRQEHAGAAQQRPERRRLQPPGEADARLLGARRCPRRRASPRRAALGARRRASGRGGAWPGRRRRRPRRDPGRRAACPTVAEGSTGTRTTTGRRRARRGRRRTPPATSRARPAPRPAAGARPAAATRRGARAGWRPRSRPARSPPGRGHSSAEVVEQ